MEYSLIIDSNDIEELLKHAELCFPMESVALLFGNIQGNRVLVKTVEPLENDAKSNTRFSVDPVLQYNLLVDAEEKGEELVCVFHSHPAPPQPSSTDLRNMRLNPVVWLIASKLTGEWRYNAFILNNNDIDEVNIILS